MPRRVVADPEGGFPGKMEEGGTWVQGIYRYVAYVYGPGEVPPAGIDLATIAELRAKYWNSERGTLLVPFPGGRTYEFGPKLLSQTTDTTVVHVRPEFWFPHGGPPPEVCSCGRLSFRHAVSYHDTAGHLMAIDSVR
ncbi:MAG: hypothetical protein ACRDF9_12405 [Candidatus Limnocylindria bacterium]